MDGLNHSLWVERYRPSDLNTYIGNEHLKSKVSIYLESEDVPHLLLYGVAGTGKTTLAKIIVNNIDCDCLYINASDENNVDNVRTKIKNFASSIGFRSLKVVILDEADFLTPNAQAALRNLMETFSKHCRFILTCNYVERIIDPIQSRCQPYKIVPPSRKEVALQLKGILETENVNFKLDDLALIVNAGYPGDGSKFNDIRKLIADNSVSDYAELYRLLYDEVDDYSNGKVAECILAIAEGEFNDVNVVDKEICFMSTLIKIMRIIK